MCPLHSPQNWHHGVPAAQVTLHDHVCLPPPSSSSPAVGQQRLPALVSPLKLVEKSWHWLSTPPPACSTGWCSCMSCLCRCCLRTSQDNVPHQLFARSVYFTLCTLQCYCQCLWPPLQWKSVMFGSCAFFTRAQEGTDETEKRGRAGARCSPSPLQSPPPLLTVIALFLPLALFPT